MHSDPYFFRGQFHSELSEAVDAGFNQSGLSLKVAGYGGPSLVSGLKGYVTVLLGAFVNPDEMNRMYKRDRAK